MKTLFSIGEELLKLYDSVDDSGEVNEEFERLANDLAQDEAKKLDGYIAIIAQMEMEEAACKAQVEQWSMKAKARANCVQRLKERIKGHLEATGRKEVVTASGRKIAIQASGGSLPVIVDDIAIDDVPKELCTVKVEVSRTKIADALKAGKELAFARFGPRGSYLKIK